MTSPIEEAEQRIYIDGRVNATLDWSAAVKTALEAVAEGRKILWQMDLGLFSNLNMPLSHQMQLQTLNLSLDHFFHTVWKEFHQNSKGLVLFSGDVDLSKGFPWDDTLKANWKEWLEDKFGSVEILNQECGLHCSSFHEITPTGNNGTPLSNLVRLFCRDTAADYLNLMVNSVSDSLPLYLEWSASENMDPLLFYQLTSSESFVRFHSIYKGGISQALGLCSTGSSDDRSLGDAVRVGICLPGIDFVKPVQLNNLRLALTQLRMSKIPYVVIPEEFLIQQWQGLDYILYSSRCLASQGKRKLQGFCAASGIAVAVDAHLGLPEEMTLSQFLTHIPQVGYF